MNFASPESILVSSQPSNTSPLFRVATFPTSSSPGRTITASLEEAPYPPNTVEHFLPATCSRPGPVLGVGNGVFRTPNIGKYDQIKNSASPDSFSVSSQPERSFPWNGVTSFTQQSLHRSVQLLSSNGDTSSPGRKITVGTKEAPDPPNTVEPLQPATCSRPGPVLGVGDGVFRSPNVGKYHPQSNASAPDSNPISSAAAAQQTASDVIIYYQNVGGMNGLIDDYHLAFLDHGYDVIVLTETWLDSRTVSSYIFGEGYEVFRCDRNTNNSCKTVGGGVLVGVHTRLKASLIENESWISVEQVWVAIQLSDRKLYLCVVYIPPDRTRDMDYINTHCQSIAVVSEYATPSDEMIVLGDFNLPDIAWTPTHSGFLCPDYQRTSLHVGAVNLLDQCFPNFFNFRPLEANINLESPP